MTNLQLVPYTPRDLLALIDSEAAFAQSFGKPAANGLRRFVVGEDVSPEWIANLRASEIAIADPWQFGFAVVHTGSDTVIGNVGFVGPPDDDGMAELAYGIVPSWEGRGLATEAAQAGVGFALADERVKGIRAHTMSERNASTRILEKLGFTRVGEIKHPEDGIIWQWQQLVAQR